MQPTEQISPEEMQRNMVIGEMTALRLQPIKQLPMTLIFLMMAGNDISIFTIMFVGMAFISPITTLIKTSEAFSRFDASAAADKYIASALSQSKFIYAGCCLISFGVALMKLQWMGLLPVCKMDWMSSTPLIPGERSFGSILI